MKKNTIILPGCFLAFKAFNPRPKTLAQSHSMLIIFTLLSLFPLCMSCLSAANINRSLQRWAKSLPSIVLIDFSKALSGNSEALLKRFEGGKKIKMKIPKVLAGDWKNFVQWVSPRVQKFPESQIASSLEGELKIYITSFDESQGVDRRVCLPNEANGKVPKVCIQNSLYGTNQEKFFLALQERAQDIVTTVNSRPSLINCDENDDTPTRLWIYLRDTFEKSALSRNNLYINLSKIRSSICCIFTLDDKGLLRILPPRKPRLPSFKLINIPDEDITHWFDWHIIVPKSLKVESDKQLMEEYLEFHSKSNPFTNQAQMEFFRHKTMPLVPIEEVEVDSSEFDLFLSNCIAKPGPIKECSFSIDERMDLTGSQFESVLDFKKLEPFLAYYFTTYDNLAFSSEVEYTNQILKDITSPMMMSEFSGNYFYNELPEHYIKISTCSKELFAKLELINNAIHKHVSDMTMSSVDFKNHQILKCPRILWGRYVDWIMNWREQKFDADLLAVMSEYAKLRSNPCLDKAKFKAAFAQALESQLAIREWIESEARNRRRQKMFLIVLSIIIGLFGIILNALLWMKKGGDKKDKDNK